MFICLLAIWLHTPIPSTARVHVGITVRTVSGTILTETHIQHALLGQDLLDAMLDIVEDTSRAFAKLLHGARRIDTARPILDQGVVDGAELTFVWVSIAKKRQRDVVEKILESPFASPRLDEDEVDALTALLL